MFYRVDRMAWDELSPRESEAARERLEALCAANNNASHPSLRCFANVSGKADLAFWLFHEDLAQLAQMHRDLEACFPAGSIDLVYSYFSVTELTEYQPTEDDLKARAQREFKLEEGTPEFDAKMKELMAWKVDYEKLRLYPIVANDALLDRACGHSITSPHFTDLAAFFREIIFFALRVGLVMAILHPPRPVASQLPI